MRGIHTLRVEAQTELPGDAALPGRAAKAENVTAARVIGAVRENFMTGSLLQMSTPRNGEAFSLGTSGLPADFFTAEGKNGGGLE
jgi:hypothetical protein